MADKPTQEEISAFLDGLRAYRATIPPRQQEMLDVMVIGTLNRRIVEEDAEVQTYWATYGGLGTGYRTGYGTGYGFGYNSTDYVVFHPDPAGYSW
jgi:hypothetical protein